MEVKIVKKETIKPSSPTPFHLKTYTFSVIDQVAPSVYISLVFMYPNDNNNNNHNHRYDEFSQNLKNSLSETLTLFPPLAGKIKDNVSVDCNDNGVLCYETRVDSTLAQLMLHRDMECLNRLVIAGDDVNVDSGSQLLVQINLFNCGGIALGVRFSHKLCDAATLATFLKSWSAKAINSGQVIVPDLTAASTTFPPRKDISITQTVISPILPHNLTTTRLVFDSSNVAALKEKTASQNTPQPTRVEAVTALISKCAMSASESNRKEGHSMPYVFTYSANIRGKLIPSLKETAFGNIVSLYAAAHSEQSSASLDVLVDMFRKGRMEFYDNLALNGRDKIDEYVEMIERSLKLYEGDSPVVVEMYVFSSWCRFGLYEAADFGLGKPAWIGFPIAAFKNVTILMDTEDGNGIEAHVCLMKQDMLLFQADPLLLQYASVYPAAV